MKLAEVLKGINILSTNTTGGEDITGITYDSRKVEPGFIFAALKGANSDGMDFVGKAAKSGATVVLANRPDPAATPDLGWVRVDDLREALALAAANFYGYPSDRLKTVGVTGTKGKTTVTYILESILTAAGASVGVIGTIEYRYPGVRITAGRTTPESTDLQSMLKGMVDTGVSHCIMEVSSHSLEQKRVWGISYDVTVFTNLTGEHLDFHPSMESYFEAKKKLFFLDHKKNVSVVNMDDPWGRKLITELPMKTITFGFEPAAIVRALKFIMSDKGMEFQICFPGGTMDINTRLVGRHNVYNILAAVSSALVLNISPSDIVRGIAALQGVPGRFEKVDNDRGILLVVDYAHTDNALENLLITGREFKPRRLIVVFGAGGNRDKTKRERMGRVAARLADWTILTSDNPRNEDPLEIITGIEGGFKKEESGAYEIFPDRREAIARALSIAARGDAVLIAGKGHEDYQIFRDKTIHFSDMEVLHELLARAEKG